MVSRCHHLMYTATSIVSITTHAWHQPIVASLKWCVCVWWLSGRPVAMHPEGRRFESNSSSHVGTLDKSFTRSCL